MRVKASFPEAFRFLFTPKRYKAPHGGRGCIHPDSLISTPDGNVRIADFNGGEILVFDGVAVVSAYAGRPVFYPTTQLYRVVFDDGSEIKTTTKHRFLSARGWVECGSLLCGDLIAAPQFEWQDDRNQKCCDVSPSELPASVRHCLQILAGFQWCYFEDCHQGDAPLLLAAKTALDVSQQLTDVPLHSSHSAMREDAQVVESKSIHSQLSRHLASLSGLLSKVGHNSEALGIGSADIASELLLVSSQALLLSREKSSLETQARRLAKLFLDLDSLTCRDESLRKVFGILRLDFDDSSYSSQVSCNPDLIITKSVISVEICEPSVYCDIFVPFFNNYISAGVVHHNSAKSWSIAEALILIALEPKLLFPKASKIRVLCTREIQNSIKESVHKLLADTIERLNLGKIFVVTASSIVCHNGSEFIFMGLLRNVDQIKSTEGINICWVSEAHNVSDESWELLLPTIRAEDSEIWIDFNPKFEHDATYQRWVVSPPDNCISPLVNYTDNPYFPEVLRIEMEQDKVKDFKLYEQKWLGKPMGMGGRVWTAFEKSIHVREFDPVEMAKNGNFYHGQDPHAHYYPANGWMCVFPVNERRNWPEDFHFHIYNEWPTVDGLGGYYHDLRKKLTFNGTLEDLAKEIYAGDGVEYGFKVRKRGIDTRFAKGSGGWNWATGTTQGIVEQYAKKENGGLQFTMPQESMIDSQRQLIHKLMDYNKLIPVGPYNMPQFSIHPRCKNIIASFTSHRLEEDSEKESEKFKDFSDMVRIMFAVVDKWVDPVKRAPKVYFPSSGSSFG